MTRVGADTFLEMVEGTLVSLGDMNAIDDLNDHELFYLLEVYENYSVCTAFVNLYVRVAF